MEVAVLFGLGLLLVLLAGALMWQERRRALLPGEGVVYGVDEAVRYVWERLPPDVDPPLTRADVRRILEWELHYLQQPKLRERPAVLGGMEAAEYVQERAFAQGYAYQPGPIFSVLDLQAAYLAELGAVGEPAGDDIEGQR
jgi:hypothetical protein